MGGDGSDAPSPLGPKGDGGPVPLGSTAAHDSTGIEIPVGEVEVPGRSEHPGTNGEKGSVRVFIEELSEGSMSLKGRECTIILYFYKSSGKLSG